MENLSFSLLPHQDPIIAQSIFTLWQAAYRVEGQLLGLDDFPPLRRTCEAIAGSEGQFYSLYLDHVLLAVTEILTHAVPIADISAFVVAPKAFRQGLGRFLLRKVQALLARDFEQVTVSTAAANQAAIKLYEGSGFATARHWHQANGLAMVTLLWRCTYSPSSEKQPFRNG